MSEENNCKIHVFGALAHLIFKKEIPDFDHQLSEVGSLSGIVGPAAGHE